MTVKEVEERLPISRANIRFYEKEGLLAPVRLENGYRDYREEDLEILKQIIFFRKLGIPISDIKRIMAGELAISEAVKGNVESLQARMDELAGALELCNQMLEDKNLDKGFAIDQYWQTMERKEAGGNSFVSYLHDYIVFEGESFLSMWENVFFTRLHETVANKGWLVTILLVLGICVIRGLVRHFWWKVDSFWGGFLYPFILFGIVTIIVLPLYVLNTIYQERNENAVSNELPENNQKETWWSRHPRCRCICQIFLFVAGFVLIVFGPIIYGDELIVAITGIYQNFIVAYKLVVLYFIVALYFFITLYWLNSKMGVLGNRFSGEKGYVCCLPRRMRYKVALASFVLYLLTTVLFYGWYGCAHENGLQIARMFVVKEYSWSDVNHVVLREDGHGVLEYSVFMTDGRKMNLVGGMVSSGSFDKEKYPEEETGFILDLTRQLVRQGVTFDADWTDLEKKLLYDYWKDYAEKLHKVIEAGE